VLSTLGAPQRHRMVGRRRRTIDAAEPEPVPTTRVTVVRPEPFDDTEQAERWLEQLTRDGDGAQQEMDAAARIVNRALHAQRVATGDPAVRDVAVGGALVARIGFGRGDAVADGRYERAFELPRGPTPRRARSMETPEELFAALLGGREQSLACEELVLRVRSDLDAHRSREAALEARVALEALLAEVPEAAIALADDRSEIGNAANAALQGALTDAQTATLATALARMEAVLRRRRLNRKG
jgi:hypothetical protein